LPVLEAQELDRLAALVGEGDLAELRWKLVHALRSESCAHDSRLYEHLRLTVAGRLAVDQPTYSALTSVASMAG